MKGIVLTEKNTEAIYGRLKKFFMKKSSFINYHNYYCGSKKHIKDTLRYPGYESLSTREELRINCIAIDEKGKTIYIMDSKGLFSIDIHLGDKIQFCGSFIKIKLCQMVLNQPIYRYEVFQIDK